MADTTPTHIPILSRYGGGMNFRAWAPNSLATSTTWPSANLAMYLPFSLPWSYTVNRLELRNGSTAAGNWDLGVYNFSGVKLASSGAVAQSGTVTIQYFSLAAPLTLSAGDYYLGISCSTNTGTFGGSSTSMTSFGRLMGLYQQASAHPLPATTTFAAWAQATPPFVGLTRTSANY